jgi:hypothetical protein
MVSPRVISCGANGSTQESAHEGKLRTARAEVLLMRDHLGALGAACASSLPTWSTTWGPSMQAAPNPATWSTTRAVWMRILHRTPPRGRVNGQKTHRTPIRGRPPGALGCRRRTGPAIPANIRDAAVLSNSRTKGSSVQRVQKSCSCATTRGSSARESAH